MTDMNMGVATELGSFGSFAVMWLAMTGAMMLPSAAPAIVQRARVDPRSVVLFVLAYVAVWQLAGVAGFAADRPHGAVVAGLAVIAAGLYEASPLKRLCRERCQGRAGFDYGLYCVGANVGLMAILLAVAPMSMAWMAVIGAVMIAQKLLPVSPTIDAPFALVIVAYGVLTVVLPGYAPGLSA
jgi:predicted metal-binding membrane protein